MVAGLDPKEAPRRLRRLAAEVFVLGYPLLLTDAVRRAHPLAFNQFFHLADHCETLAPGFIHEDVRTLRTSAWLDLSRGPVILTLPDMRGRHSILSLIDAWGQTFASFGSRTHLDAGCDIAVVGPDWQGELAPGLVARRARTDIVWALSRIVAHSAGDRAATRALLDHHYVLPLSGGLETIAPGGAVMDPPPRALPEQVAALDPATCFPRLEALLRRHPLRHGDQATLSAFERLDAAAALETGRNEVSSLLAEAAAKGLRDGRAMIRGAAIAAASGAGRWRRAITARAEDDPLTRAAGAYFALGAPDPSEVLALVCGADSQGEALTGACRYRLHFERDQLPPAKAFWSLALTDPPGRSELALRRCGLSDRDGVIFNRDGSLDLFVQHDAPSPGRVGNWLPAPAGAFSLTMRLHWPQAPALSGQWTMPHLEARSPDRARPAGVSSTRAV